MAKKHTPGPWVIRHDHITTEDIKHRGFSDKICTPEWGDELENEANTNLISAAPELLEALKKLYGKFAFKCPAGLRKEVKQAIAKAEGK